jgi:hypothetical protein
VLGPAVLGGRALVAPEEEAKEEGCLVRGMRSGLIRSRDPGRTRGCGILGVTPPAARPGDSFTGSVAGPRTGLTESPARVRPPGLTPPAAESADDVPTPETTVMDGSLEAGEPKSGTDDAAAEAEAARVGTGESGAAEPGAGAAAAGTTAGTGPEERRDRKAARAAASAAGSAESVAGRAGCGSSDDAPLRGRRLAAAEAGPAAAGRVAAGA